ATYFNSSDLSGAGITRLEPDVNFEWGNGSPDGVNADNFSARFEGSLTPRHDEVYTFILNADDGVRLWVNGVRLVNRWEYAPHTDYAKLKLRGWQTLRDQTRVPRRHRRRDVAPRVANVPASLERSSRTRFCHPRRASRKACRKTRRCGSWRTLEASSWERKSRRRSTKNDAKLREVATREFNHLQPGSECMAVSTHDGSGDPLRLRLDASGRLEPFDTLVDAARQNDQSVQCFHLIWYIEAVWGTWLAQLSTDQRRSFMTNRLRDLLTRYQGRLEAWNVVNEAFSDDGTLRPREFQMEGKTNLNWVYDLGTGTEYIEEAFRLARAADQDAKLFYNDYGMEWGNAGNPNRKWLGVLNMVRDFEARGVPIDGVGFQSHLAIAWGSPPNMVNPDDTARDLAGYWRELYALNPKLEVRITELDVNIGEPSSLSETERLQIQARFFGNLTRACLSAPNCTGVSTWGVTDKYSWITKPEWNGKPENKPLMFDEGFQPKPAYYALRDALLGR
ncbi:MAG: hypothetical protein HC933_22900, partial [Pleurocapsa sp. SU_196_0]|nr:hypothetical protein [Pleurocapsa sp. SU_196_0]